MPPKPLHDLSTVDLEKVLYDIDTIRTQNPQRFEFEQLTAIHAYLPEELVVVGSRQIGEGEFWERGHIPGNPVFPGVLMIECAAQVCSFFQGLYFDSGNFFGFGGVDGVRFRQTVRAGDRLVVIAKGKTVRPRRSLFACQGFVGDAMAFEAEITGITMGSKS